MKIEGTGNLIQNLQGIRQKTVVPEKSTKSAPEGISCRNNSVEISSYATEMSSLENDIKNLPDVRAGRVAELKQQIESGQYKIDEDRLADVLSNFV